MPRRASATQEKQACASRPQPQRPKGSCPVECRPVCKKHFLGTPSSASMARTHPSAQVAWHLKKPIWPSQTKLHERTKTQLAVVGISNRHASTLAHRRDLRAFAWPAVYFALKVPQDNSIDRLIVRDDPDYLASRAFAKVFGDSEYIILLAEAPDPFAGPVVKRIDEMENRLRSIPGCR